MRVGADAFGRIEYLGLNCECGFALKVLGNNDPGLLRWSFTPPAAVVPLIDADFASLYEPDALIPCGPNMVEDTLYQISFHTNVRTELRGEAWCFVDDDAGRRNRIFAAEQTLISSYAAKFRKQFTRPDTLYLLTRHDDGPLEPTREIQAAIRARSGDTPFALLEIRAADRAQPAPAVAKVDDNVYLGYVDFFAPLDRSNEIDIEGWRRVLAEVLDLTRSD